MTTTRRVPPGRAGRLRLRRKLDAANRGADLLERKLRVLRAEHQRRLDSEGAATRAWHERSREAEQWSLRGLLLSGERALDMACPAAAAQVDVEWATSMGVRHPAAVSYAAAVRAATEPLPRNTALAHAQRAYQDAVRAAAEYAVARAATRLVGAEVARTRQRVRALRRHWIPQLTEVLAAADLALEQAEHEDFVRRRWATEARRTACWRGDGRRRQP
ncbi:V-type ATP synthase subunit D [Streptantibioticus rubrisoli]|uniref:V-type ATP synthase subunit D n=1 Tax=Streptantibioticus rubrisoli TaxID=1387313 RepID=A0ABT1PEI0_9ACTN|nr:V-type ATP synthase subunit D [Streptantibioticus rubrisoli]MCQ4042735.1 V-type ATP synthase subunit D [Streptantibioticus rubrisoli]